jgi:hypothetical protein
MGNKISLGDIESRLGKSATRTSQSYDDYGDTAPQRGPNRFQQEQDEDEGSTLSAGFIATCVAAFIAVGGGTFFFAGGSFDLRSLTTWKRNGVYLDYVSKSDARCKKGWGDNRENRDQLHCYFTRDVARLCDPQEKGHLLNMVDLFQDGAARYGAVAMSETMQLVGNQGKMMQLGMADAMTRAEGLSEEEQMRSMEKVMGMADEMMSGVNQHMSQNVNEKKIDDLKIALRSLIASGYLSPDDFGWAKPDWIEAAIAGVKIPAASPCNRT